MCRAGPFCVEYCAHSEEKYASCNTDGKLPPRTVYFSSNKILQDKQQETMEAIIGTKVQ